MLSVGCTSLVATTNLTILETEGRRGPMLLAEGLGLIVHATLKTYIFLNAVFKQMQAKLLSLYMLLEILLNFL